MNSIHRYIQLLKFCEMTMEKNYSPTSLSLVQCVIYASPVAALYLMMGGMNIMQALYAKYFGLSLATIATVLLFSRIFDAFTDPLIGQLSDRYHDKNGTRKPFVVAGGLLFIIAAYFLFVPGEFSPMTAVDPTDTESRHITATYFVVALFAFYLTYTLFDIPHTAWASDISPSGKDKNRIFVIRSAAQTFSLLLFYLVPFLPVFETRDITPQTLQWAVMLGVCLLLPGLFMMAKTIPNKPRKAQALEQDPVELTVSRRTDHKPRVGIKQLVSVLVDNRPFLLFFLAFGVMTIGSGMVASMLFFFVDAYLGIGEQFASLSLISWVFSFLSLYVSYKMFMLVGKAMSWVVLLSLAAACLLILPTLQPGGDNFLAVAIVKVLFNVAFGAVWALGNSQLSHIIDYNILKTGDDRAATYYAVHALGLKTNMAIGMALGLAVASWFGFDPAASDHSDMAVFGLHLSLVYMPGLTFLVGMGLFLINPLTESRNQMIRRRLDDRLAREARDAELQSLKSNHSSRKENSHFTVGELKSSA